MFNAGWANGCGVELFTHGWVRCDSQSVPYVPVNKPVLSSGGLQQQNNDLLLLLAQSIFQIID